MGRKIPGKKHRGVKDPFKQHAKREAELEKKINAPPKNTDEQAIPKSLERVVKLKEAVKSGRISTAIKKRKKKKNRLIRIGGDAPKLSHPKAKPEKVVPLFEQRPGETPNHFLYRVGRDTHAFLNETAFEKKYNVEVKRNPGTGRVEGLGKRQKDELDDIEMLRAKHKNIKKKKESQKPKLSKAQRKKEKVKLKMEKKEEEGGKDFDSFKDEIKFGEIAHEPPQLRARPTKADTSSSDKPGKKNLLLHSLLNNSEASKMVSMKTPALDKTGKRKNLPVGERRQLEKQQTDVIAAYRRLKAQRPTGASS